MASEKTYKKRKVGDIVKIKQHLTEVDKALSYWHSQNRTGLMEKSVGYVGVIYDNNGAYVNGEHPAEENLWLVKINGRYLWFHGSLLKRAFRSQLTRSLKRYEEAKAAASEGRRRGKR